MRYVICPQCKTENSGSLLVCSACGSDLIGIERREKPDAPQYLTPSAPLPGIPISPVYSSNPPVTVHPPQRKITSQNRMLKGANWFYWIAGLSLVNCVLARTSSDTRFIIGLGSTQLIDVIAQAFINDEPGLSIVFHSASIVFDMIILGTIALFGILGRKGVRPVFIIGIILYALDSLVCIVFEDYIGAASHLIGLVGLYSGMRASYDYAKLIHE